MAGLIDKLFSTARERSLLSAPDEWGFLCGIKISGELHRLGEIRCGGSVSSVRFRRVGVLL